MSATVADNGFGPVAHSRFVYREGHLLLPGEINGTPTYFAVGNEPRTKISPELLQQQGRKVKLSLAGEKIELDTVDQLSSHAAYDVDNYTAGGVIGLDVLRNYCLEIDFLRRQLALVRGSSLIKEDEPNTVILQKEPWGLLADKNIPFIIDPGSPISVLPSSYHTADAPPAVLEETIYIPGQDAPAKVAYTRLSSLRLSPVVALKKPTFARSLDEAHPLQIWGHPYGVVGARDLRDFVVTMDYANNRVKLARSAEIGAREVFVSMMDDFQNLPSRGQLLCRLCHQWHDAAGANGQSNVVELSAYLSHPDLPESQYPAIDTKLQASRDRAALGLFAALWAVLHEKKFPVLSSPVGTMHRLEIAEKRAPEEPFIQSKLAEAYLQQGDLNRARDHAAKALRVDAGYYDALVVLQKIAEHAKDDAQVQRLKEAMHSYHGSLSSKTE